MKKTKEELLRRMAKIKADIQDIQLWIDDAPTNRIARIRYGKTKEKLRELVKKHQRLAQKEGTL